MKRTIKIGTRQSQLALWQAEYVRSKLLSRYPSRKVELVKIMSEGDKILDIPLFQVGGKGLFLKELEQALLREEIDLAVHSMKDVAVLLPKGLHIPVFCPREDPRDALVSNHYPSLEELPPGAVVGTCSLRRQSQLRAALPHLKLTNLRGNLNTRLSRLDHGDYDAIILAAAGLQRLGFDGRIRQLIDTSICLPAVGQGVVGIECRIEDEEINNLIQPINNMESEIVIQAERTANQYLGGGCHVPIAVYAELDQYQLNIRGLVSELDGSRILRAEYHGEARESMKLSKRIADDLLNQGADRILNAVYNR